MVIFLATFIALLQCYTGLVKKERKEFVVLGIDPGLAETGFGIISCKKEKATQICYGCFKTSNKDTPSERLKVIFESTLTVLEEHRPQILAMESLFFAVNVRSASAVSQAIGVIKLAAAQKGITVFEYPPLKIKMKLVGKGRAKKPEVQEEVKKRLKLEKIPRPNHAADALAVALCHWLETNNK